MKELIVIILALDVIAEIFLVRRLRKERDNAEERATTHIKRADKFERQLQETVKEYEEQAQILLENASELRSENEELGILKYNITKIIESNDFAHDKVDKIKKELVRPGNQN